MEWYDIVLSYLKVILSWPVIVLIIALAFRKELQKLPARLDQVILGKDQRIIFSRARSKKITASLDEVAKKPKVSKRQQEQLQSDIDSIFELGVAVGLSRKGEPVTDTTNVQLIKDENGNITGLQYNER